MTFGRWYVRLATVFAIMHLYNLFPLYIPFFIFFLYSGIDKLDRTVDDTCMS